MQELSLFGLRSSGRSIQAENVGQHHSFGVCCENPAHQHSFVRNQFETERLRSGAYCIRGFDHTRGRSWEPYPSKCISVIFSADLSSSCTVAESEDSIFSRTCIFAPSFVSVPCQWPPKLDVITNGDGEGPAVSSS